jgi:hypothetical protein
LLLLRLLLLSSHLPLLLSRLLLFLSRLLQHLSLPQRLHLRQLQSRRRSRRRLM